jgi:hypothetical protein
MQNNIIPPVKAGAIPKDVNKLIRTVVTKPKLVQNTS